jgi:hypothetical protein
VFEDVVGKGTHGSSDSTSIGAVLYDNGPMKHALYDQLTTPTRPPKLNRKTYRSPYSLTVTGTLVLMTV